jgi:hypothetical protein
MQNNVSVKQIHICFLHGHVKQCNFFLLLLKEWGFHNVFGDRPTKWPIAKKPSKHSPTTN